MQKNVGTGDRAIRTILALSIGILLVTGILNGILGVILGVLALVFLVTGVLSRCPFYLPFHIATNRTGRR